MKKLIHSFVNLFLALSILFSVSIIAAEEGMTRADYDEYLALFNANDPSFIKFLSF